MANHQHKTLLEAHNRPTPISPTRDQDRVTVMIHQSEERKKASDEYVELEISTVPRSPRQGRHLDRDLYSPPLHDPPTTVTVTKTPHSGPRKQVTTSRNQYNTRSRGRQSDKETSGSENISIIAQSVMRGFPILPNVLMFSSGQRTLKSKNIQNPLDHPRNGLGMSKNLARQ